MYMYEISILIELYKYKYINIFIFKFNLNKINPGHVCVYPVIKFSQMKIRVTWNILLAKREKN